MKVWDSMTAKAVTKAEEKAMATSPCVSWTPLARMSERVGRLSKDCDRSGNQDDEKSTYQRSWTLTIALGDLHLVGLLP